MSVTDERIQDLNRRFLEFMGKPENVDTATKEIYEDLLDEVLMGFVFDVHRMTKTGSSDVEEGIPDDESYAIVGKDRVSWDSDGVGGHTLCHLNEDLSCFSPT